MIGGRSIIIEYLESSQNTMVTQLLDIIIYSCCPHVLTLQELPYHVPCSHRVGVVELTNFPWVEVYFLHNGRDFGINYVSPKHSFYLV